MPSQSYPKCQRLRTSGAVRYSKDRTITEVVSTASVNLRGNKRRSGWWGKAKLRKCVESVQLRVCYEEYLKLTAGSIRVHQRVDGIQSWRSFQASFNISPK